MTLFTQVKLVKFFNMYIVQVNGVFTYTGKTALLVISIRQNIILLLLIQIKRHYMYYFSDTGKTSIFRYLYTKDVIRTLILLIKRNFFLNDTGKSHSNVTSQGKTLLFRFSQLKRHPYVIDTGQTPLLRYLYSQNVILKILIPT